MLEVREHIELNPETVERGYKSCRSVAKSYFSDTIWMISNLPRDRRRGMDALLAQVVRTYDFLDLESPNHLSLDVWTEIRDDVADSFNEKCTSVELAALGDTCRHFKIPKQYLMDMLEGADWWTRAHQIETFDELLVMAYRLGGAAMLAAVPILGEIKQGYETAAIRCGQAVFLTQILANCVENLKRNMSLIPVEDFEACEVEMPRLRLRQHRKSVDYFVATLL